MILQDDLEMLAYVNARSRDCGSFLSHFFQACYRADVFNYALLRPALEQIRLKYPAEPEILAAEREGVGLDPVED